MEPVNIPFGTCQQRKLFPHFHPPNFLGNKFLPLRGVPHRGPGCYIADDVSIHLPLVGLSSGLPKVALVCGRKALWDLWSLRSQHKKEPWTSETRSQGQCQKLKDLFSALCVSTKCKLLLHITLSIVPSPLASPKVCEAMSLTVSLFPAGLCSVVRSGYQIT